MKLLFASTTDASEIRALVPSPTNVGREDVAVTARLTRTQWMVLASYRFLTRADAQNWRNEIGTLMADARVLPGSRASIHNCTHGDEVEVPCNTSLIEVIK